MKRILFILLLLPTLLQAQNSWVNVQLYTDNYPEETSWTITPPGGSPIIAQNDSGMIDLTLYSDTIQLGGTIIVSIFDQYGDGLGGFNGSPEGWFLVQNDCQDTIMYVAGDFGYNYIDTLTIAPCAPPVVIPGCTDINAINYDSLATTDNGTCTYPPCGGFLTSTASQICLPNGQTLAQFFWTLDNNVSCEPVFFWYSNEDGVGPFQYGLGPNSLDFAVYAGNGQMPPNWEVEHYGWVEFADGSLSDTIATTPTPCIAGCTDPTQISYNPWATFDDGSCAGTTCDTATQYQISLSLTLDNWPGETSWQFVDGLGNTFDYPVGTYDFNDIGQTYNYSFCVDQNAAFELIINDDFGDGMAGSTSGGSIDGAAIIYDCSGDTVWYMDNPGFGNVLYSGPQTASPCPVTPTIDGCTDDDYVEFNPAANNDDGSCLTLHTYGCTDSSAFNYDAAATIMDLIPDCNYLLEIFDAGGDGWGNSFIGIYQNGIDLGTYTMGPGNYGSSWNIILDPGVPVEVRYFEVGGPQQPPQEVQFQTWHNSFKLTNVDGFVLLHEGVNPFSNNGQGALQSFESPFWTKYINIPFCGNTCVPKIFGCMDSTAFNYNDSANTSAPCIPVVLGCTNPIAFNFDPNANVDDSTCVAEVIGCMDSTAFNYNPSANTNDPASCVPVILGCMDDTMFNYNPAANTPDGSCIPIVFGCTDALAFNYDSTANTNNGSCIPFIYGCTNPSAINYDPLANTDDSSCIGIIYGCTDLTMFNYDPLANTDNGSCEPFVYGCMDSTQFNFNPLANTNDNNCIPFIYGCTDPSMLNYDPSANTEDFSCIPFLYGCTDSTALNYDPVANTDNGSCIDVVEGCMDQGAYNYDPLANVDDSTSCLYNAGCIDGPGNPYWLNDGCYAWVIDVDQYCCENAWDPTCQQMYDYCQLGWPTTVEDLSMVGIVVFPNPSSGIFRIETRLKICVKVYDMQGKLIVDEDEVNMIDLSDQPTGLYNLHIETDGKIFSNKIIKN